MVRTTLHVTSFLTCVLIVFGIGFSLAKWVGGLWAFFPYNYQVQRVINTPRPGERILLQVEVDRIASCPATFTREIWDGAGVRVNNDTYETPPRQLGKHTPIYGSLLSPTATPGKGLYCVSQQPKCNIIQQWFPFTAPPKCVEFTIKEPGNDKTSMVSGSPES